jgi:2-oxoglutaroyl-CoA hydrolase
MVMRSKRISGKQAYEWGISTEWVPDGNLETTTDELVKELRAFSPLAQRTAKKLLNDTEDAASLRRLNLRAIAIAGSGSRTTFVRASKHSTPSGRQKFGGR